MRMLAVFEKGERIRHIGHLDIQRSVQRGLRRSGLPVAYSNGFNPHILITFASALSTGACGTHEIMDVTMAEEVSEREFLDRMNKAMPPEMQLSQARAVDQKHPALMASLRAANYDLLIRNEDQAEKLICRNMLDSLNRYFQVDFTSDEKSGLISQTGEGLSWEVRETIFGCFA